MISQHHSISFFILFNLPIHNPAWIVGERFVYVPFFMFHAAEEMPPTAQPLTKFRNFRFSKNALDFSNTPTIRFQCALSRGVLKKDSWHRGNTFNSSPQLSPPPSTEKPRNQSVEVIPVGPMVFGPSAAFKSNSSVTRTSVSAKVILPERLLG